jgi:AcrR family transcriptional regulator
VKSGSRVPQPVPQSKSGPSETPARAERLQEIKNAAATLFYANGYAGTDLRAVAEAVGLHVSSFYNYISSKEDLLYLISLDGIESANATLDEVIRRETDPGLRLEAAIRAHIEHHLRRRHSAWAANVEIRSLTGTYRSEIRRLRKEFESRWIELVKDAVDSGSIKTESIELTVVSILSVSQGLSRWHNAGRSPAPREIGQVLANQIMHGLAI